MPEEKITPQRLRDHFRRLWFIYLAAIAILLFINNLIFTVTRPSFSDDETLKIMLLNVEAQLDGDALLAALPDAGILAVETETLAAADIQDSTSNMLLAVKLTAGFGDIYITDAGGLAQLESRAACLDLGGVDVPGLKPAACIHPETGQAYTGALKTANELYLVIPSNSTNIDQAKEALPALAAMITE